jgi:hypothetical protein
MAISKKAWTGNAKEATAGTAITVPIRYLPTKTVFKGGKKREYLNEERGDRNANYGVVDSVRQSSIEMKGPWYNDVMPTVLWGAFGLPSSTQPDSTNAPTVWKHAFQLQDIPPSYTTHRSMDSKTYYVPYSSVEKFVLSFVADGKLLEIDSTWLGLFAQILGSPPTPTYSTLLPFAGYAPTIKLIDGAVNQDIEDLSIEYDQKLGLWYPANGTQDFVTIYFGERTAKISFTARFDNDTIYQRWRLNQPDSLIVDVQGLNIAKIYTVTLGGPSAGTFTLTYNGQTTANIAFNATGATTQTAFQLLSGVSTNATVTGGAGGPYTVIFAGPLLNDGFVLTGSGAGLTGGTFSVGAQVGYAQELNFNFPNISYDTVEHDLGKENVLIKAKATAIVPQGSALLSGFVQNTITGAIMLT